MQYSIGEFSRISNRSIKGLRQMPLFHVTEIKEKSLQFVREKVKFIGHYPEWHISPEKRRGCSST